VGRPAKSAHQHFVEGTPSTAKPATESHVVAGRPRFPADLDPSLKRIFKNLCKLLSERRALTHGDVELIRIFCFQKDRHCRNVAELRKEGEIVTYFRLDANGRSVPQVTTNLRLKICTEAEKQMVSVLSALGLTPTAKDRARPTAPEAPSKDELIPGSMGWLMAEQSREAKEIKPIPFIRPEDMIPDDPEPEPEGDPDVLTDGI
jgi:P27 family predicted phage terminase small subunit